MRSFSKKLAFVLAAAMVFTSFAPAASAKAADDMAINKSSQILYVNEGINHKGAAGVAAGKGNVSEYDFYVKNKPDNYKKTLKFEWTSSDEDVATVNQSGLTTAVGVGKATISCKITEKKTGDVVTTSKVKVTVKANADDVEIKDAAKISGKVLVLENGKAEVNLDRFMYDEFGNKTSKRGTYVTDYTEWLCDKTEGVAITQSNGLYTFTEAGEYTLWCRTYQSSKYKGTTAESEKITVVVEDKTFEVYQKTSRAFDLVFNMPTTIKKDDVTVIRNFSNITGAAESYDLLIKDVVANEDGSYSVLFFDPLLDANTYTVKVKGRDDKNFVASVGEPTKVEVYLAGKAVTQQEVTVGKYAELAVKLYDANKVDVTDEHKMYYGINSYTNNIVFTVKDDSQAGSFGLVDNGDGTAGIYFDQKDDKVTVVATYYPSVPVDDKGNVIDPIESAPRTFYGVQAGALTLGGLAKYGIDSYWNKTVRLGTDNIPFFAQVATSDPNPNNWITLSRYRQEIEPADKSAFFGYANFTAINPDILSVYEETATGNVILTPNQVGKAVIAVSVMNYDSYGNDNEVTIGLAYIDVKEKAHLMKAVYDKTSITISGNPGDFDYSAADADAKIAALQAGSVTDYNTQEIENMKINLKLWHQDTNPAWNNYYPLSNVTIKEFKGSNEASKFAISEGAIDIDTNGNILICNRKFDDALEKLYAKVDYDMVQKIGSFRFGFTTEVYDSVTEKSSYATFTIDVRRHFADANHVKGHSLDLKLDGANAEIARYDDINGNDGVDHEAMKSLNFRVFEKCNLALFDEVDFLPLTNSFDNNGKVKLDGLFDGTTGGYYFKVFKDGKDVTAKALNNQLFYGFNSNSANSTPNENYGNYAKYNTAGTTTSKFDTTKTIVSYKNTDNTIGAGRYEFVLYNVATDATYKRVASKSTVLTLDTKAYSKTFRKDITLKALTDEAILKCFTITDKDGLVIDHTKTVGNTAKFKKADGSYTDERLFYIDADWTHFGGTNSNNNGDSLFIKNIVFWEAVEPGVYAEYVVAVNHFVDYRKFQQ